MAPDRGGSHSPEPAESSFRTTAITSPHESPHRGMGIPEALDDSECAGEDANNPLIGPTPRRRSDARKFLTERAEEGQNFTVRGVVVGLWIGVIICFSNMYFGLQTGWVSSMSMPSALIGFTFFKSVVRYIDFPFTPVENVLVQTVAGSLGTMPLGCGFVGVIPALEYMLKPEENGPLVLGLGRLIVWSLGICLFGVVFAVPLRKQVIIREKLKFPSGTATALMIGVLHGDKDHAGIGADQSGLETFRRRSQDLIRSSSMVGTLSSAEGVAGDEAALLTYPESNAPEEQGLGLDRRSDWKAKIKLMIIAFAISACYTILSYFIPHLRKLPVLGLHLATNWLWSLNPSPAYIGQGIIMGPATTLHMLLGAIVGWAILSPVAKSKGWAPGPVGDWTKGSKGWIVWVSLAIMLADAVISLGWLVLRPTITHGPQYLTELRDRVRGGDWKGIFHSGQAKGYTALHGAERSNYLSLTETTSSSHYSGDSPDNSTTKQPQAPHKGNDSADEDAPPSQLISNTTVAVGLLVSILICILAIHLTFGSLIPLYATLTSILLALLLSVMGVRALGETDLNPVSGISKLTQLFFALIISPSNPNAVIINLLAGAVSESGALQAGDLMQDLKTGHLLGAAPNAQFYGQLIGSVVGAVVSAGVYKLYTNVYKVPGDLFQVPTGYVWVFTARLVTGQGLPYMAWQWALGAGVIFAVATGLRIWALGRWWHAWIPGGIAVAVGMYNVPSFTLARTVGGLLNWYWRSYRRREETPIIVLASGLILGEGVMSMVNLLLASLRVPHL